ncbi:MAG: hypothetical protein LQ351_006075 [Letrouitia transgressa]|nr:MAG: hypothetical protein LQ351_006075 [Letrouitia transgressa]
MPTLGTPKHFRCVSVRGIDLSQALIIYEKNDYTGNSCYIDQNGVWGTGGILANSIDVLPRGSGNFKRCYSSGGGDDGQQTGCVAIQEQDLGSSDTCGSIAAGFPDVNSTYWYSTEDDTGEAAEPGPGGRRRRRQLVKRGDDFRLNSDNTRAIAAAVGILAYIRVPNDQTGQISGNLEVVDNTHAETNQEFLTGGSTQAWDADHIMELQLMTNFFASPQGVPYQDIWNEMRRCPETYALTTAAVNNNCNLIGLAKRINNLKGRLFRVTDDGDPVHINWSSNYLGEVQALLNYLSFLMQSFNSVVERVGRIMDEIYHRGHSSNAPPVPPSQSWTSFAQTAFDAARTRLQNARDSATRFKSEDQFEKDYKHDELR